jgi:hypothetical protein
MADRGGRGRDPGTRTWRGHPQAVADPSIFRLDGGPSIGERIRREPAIGMSGSRRTRARKGRPVVMASTSPATVGARSSPQISGSSPASSRSTRTISPTPAGARSPIPRGALPSCREVRSNGRRNEGPRLDAEAVAGGILERERGETIRMAVADPSIFRQDGGPSIGERTRRAHFRPADNTRVGKTGAMSGWDQRRARIGGGVPGAANAEDAAPKGLGRRRQIGDHPTYRNPSHRQALVP